jgi:hypothetical protein
VKETAKKMASCSMMAALCVVLMLLGAILELGMYACPLLAGLCFIPIGMRYGRKYHNMLYVATSLLCLLLVPNVEENLMFIALFGWYPIARPGLQKLPKLLRWPVKLLVFNAAVVAVEYLVMTVLAPEVMEQTFLWILLALGNVTLILYDIMIPRLTGLLKKIVKMV